MESTADQHRQMASDRGPVLVAVVTVSDSRSPETDRSGDYLRSAIEAAGHRVVSYEIVPDEPERIARTMDGLASGETRAIILNGGTGISARDRTFDVLDRMLEKHLPGFGELFRMLSWDQVGSAAMLSRATAGVYRGCLVVSMPGSPDAVRLGWERLIEPELEHLVWEIAR